MEDRLNRRARAQGGVIARADALDDGVTDRRLQRQVDRRSWRRVARGVYAAQTTPDSADLRLWTALKTAGPTAALRGRSAAWLWGLEGFPMPDRPDIAVAHTVQRSFDGWSYRRTRPVVMDRVVVRRGLRVLSLEDTIRELAAELSAQDLEALVIDMVNRTRRTTASRLLTVCGRGLAGSVALRKAVAACSDRVLSLWERRLLKILRDAGIPVVANYLVIDSDGRRRYLDLAVPEARLAIEVDGYGVHSRRDRFYDDRRRKRALVLRMGWRVVEVTPQDIRERPHDIVRDVKAFLAGIA